MHVQTSPEEQFVIIVYIHNSIVKQEESFEAMLKMIFFQKILVKDEVINFCVVYEMPLVLL